MSSFLRSLLRPAFEGLTGAVLASWTLTRLLRRAPLPVRGRIFHRLAERPLARAAVTARCAGIRMELDLGDDVQRAIYFGMFEREELELLRGCVGPDDVCIDAGANVGFFACHLARWVGPRGHVHAFEPEPRNVGRLAANLALNGLSSRVTLHPVALSAERGRARFNRAGGDHSGWGSLHRDEMHLQTIEVETTTIDAFVEEAGLEEVALLKIDVEGADFDVYHGAERLLGRRGVRCVMAEWNGVWFPRQGRSFRDFTGAFTRFGYRPIPAQRAMVEDLEERGGEAVGRILNVVFLRP